ncbi:MAG: pilus assembly protein [Roseiflexus sp.]|nr:pilus assembly protein [Roseiflexus sp.]MCS7289642.1 pilus assembly protein [Roseiflexus sp.]MDW8233978.1 pilus assembly protein [Roseiflexaceae bacterium]
MPRRSRGQSLVEMALIAPILFAFLFAIIDLGYYIWGYSTLFSAARAGAEVASQLPPYPSRLELRSRGDPRWAEDPCVQRILEVTNDSTGFFPVNAGQITIRYPNAASDPNPRRLGGTIEVQIDYVIEPLTPLVSFINTMLGDNGTMRIRVTAQRTIESLGNNPNFANGIACTEPQP